MPIFHREAFLAGANGKDTNWLQPEHFADLQGLSVALDRLSPEQRCDAIYADWLLQLNSPSRQVLLQVRNLLIDRGAIAANYLAELAQNADDASDGETAQIRIGLDGDWLFVSNNGRKVTSLNLLGLCRFFVHAAGEVVELDEQTIGRFGIGFKSCYRIASEVFVFTWDGEGQFGFRLPICREGDASSEPDRKCLEGLLTRLQAVGVAQLDTELRDNRCLGYCTPEFQRELPPELAQRAAQLRGTYRGTLFCFHLRPDRRGEVASRVTGQERELYELCPLFLRNLRSVQIGSNTLSMQVGKRDPSKDLPSEVEADKVTLTTSIFGQPQSHSRFWRLRGLGEAPVWQAALHADSQYQLRLEREEDELGLTLKDGAAYSFFPLNGMNQAWTFRFHLHLELPTKLERDNWNPADVVVVEQQLRMAVRGIVAWVDSHFSTLTRSDWGFERLVEQRPAPMRNGEDWPARWAKVVFEELCCAAIAKQLLRTIGGRRVSSEEARRVAVVKRQAAAEAWATLNATANLQEAFPCFVSEQAAVFGVEAAIPDEVAYAFSRILGAKNLHPEVRQAAMLAYLSTTEHSGASLERALKDAVVELADGSQARLGDLMSEPSGTELAPMWHACFQRLTDWAHEADWQSNHVFGLRVDDQLHKLSQPVFNPHWSQLATRLGTVEAWQEHGEQFWRTTRRPCPPAYRASALVCLRVPDGGGGWLPLESLWIDDDSPVECFAGLLRTWPLQYRDSTRQRTTDLLKEWGMFAEWERTTKKVLAEKMPGELTRQLTINASGDALAVVFSKTFHDARRHLEGGWAHVVNEAEKTAVSRFVRARSDEEKLGAKTLVSVSISSGVRAALSLVDDFVSAPAWLSDTAYARICALGLQQNLSFEFLSRQQSDRESERLGQLVLDGFYRWRQTEPRDLLLQGFEDLFGNVGVQRRRDLFVALSTQRRRRIREFFATLTPGSASTPAERLMAARLERAEKKVDPMPFPLDRIHALAEVAVHFGNLRCERESGGEVPLHDGQIDPTIAQNGDVEALLKEGCPIYGASQGLRLKWLSGDDLVAELKDADVGWFGDRLVFGHFGRPASEEQYVRMLSLYELSDVVPDEYQKAKRRGASAFDLYADFRDRIVGVLVKKHVREVGYGREHILRELLQNAESAYASKLQAVDAPWFEFRVELGERANEQTVRVRHAGRTFNEPDRLGQPRPDIERIVKINAPNANTEEELGRFNRGFKSVFTVAKDGRVRVRSGPFAFEIHDLLLLSPAQPSPDQTRQAETEFMFVVSQADALGMLGLGSVPTGRVAPESVNMTTLLFLTQLRRVRIQWGDKHWEWQMARRQAADGWVRVEVKEATGGKAEVFLAHSGRLSDNRRFGVAIRLGKDDEPQPLDKGWHRLRLTFETECAFGFDVLVNGDFEADQGRLSLRRLASSGADIIEAALNAAFERCSRGLAEGFSKVRWLAWARVLHLKDAREVFEAEFTDAAARFTRLLRPFEDLMASQVPCGQGPLPLREACFPSRLMRRLGKDFACRWGIPTGIWIEHEAEEELPQHIRDQHAKFSLHKWISVLSREERVLLRTVRADLSGPAFEALKRSLGKPERDELAEAERLLEEKLRSVQPEDPEPEIELPVVEEWSIGDLWHWWEQRGKPTSEYTLDGSENWSLWGLMDCANACNRPANARELEPGSNFSERTDLLRDALQAVDSEKCRRLWYRLFGFACLMSAGRRMSEVRAFWRNELGGRNFWEITSKATIDGGSDALFEELVRRPFISANASGEHAYFWRRVFYDIRKMHLLVWGQYKLPETLLQLAAAGRGDQLIEFLKSGRLRGQEAWAGVFGQSASSPLFFLVRELCRIGVIRSSEVQPYAFFVSTPVRRAMARIGWLGWESVGESDFQSLASLSVELHGRIRADREFGPKLLPYFDIPLLHLGVNG